jgi:predicted membrane channel-forming protein YqfA (hemolysin III family)
MSENTGVYIILGILTFGWVLGIIATYRKKKEPRIMGFWDYVVLGIAVIWVGALIVFTTVR